MNISIITATYNVEQTISACLDSLQRQTIPFEHLVIDGLSTDGTLDVIKQQSPGSCIHSDKDNGLYYALNKGISLATGDVIGILHADDFYSHDKVLAKVEKVFEDPEVEGCYGDLLYISGAKGFHERTSEKFRDSKPHYTIKRYWKSGPYSPRKFYWGWMPPHPTFFVRKSLYDKYGLFNLKLGTAADYELMLRFLVKHQINCSYIPEILVNMRVGGMSNASLLNRLKANINDRKSWTINGLRPYPWTNILKPIRKLPQYVLRP